jgi:S-adenosylmethionine/arginine decarboxylase-like enzyme
MEGSDMNEFVPDHVHFFATATLQKQRFTEPQISDWLSRLVRAVDMEVLAGPFVCTCNDVGNEGITGAVVLSTSHSTLHIWDQTSEPYLKMDLYSCKRFSNHTVLMMLRELNPRVVNFTVIDRNHIDEANMLENKWHSITEEGIYDFRY